MPPRPLTRRARASCLTMIAILLAACAPGPPRVETTPAGGVGISSGPRWGWATKRVAEKVAPATLVADDGTVCRVSPDRYKATTHGSLVRCDWQPGAPPADTTPRSRRSR